MSKSGLEPAFPSRYEDIDWPGITLRDWFAGQAAIGLAAKTGNCAFLGPDAFRIADAMLAERDKPEPISPAAESEEP